MVDLLELEGCNVLVSHLPTFTMDMYTGWMWGVGIELPTFLVIIYSTSLSTSAYQFSNHQ